MSRTDDTGPNDDTDLNGELTDGALDDSDTELIDGTDEAAGIAVDGTGEIASGDAR